jgi:tetratricopeptide (TPR) repeat protein
MFRPIRLSREETRRLWIVVALMAALIVLAVLQATIGAMERMPQPLSSIDMGAATPLPDLLVDPQDQTLLVWDALNALHENDYEAAIAMWEGVLLRDEAEVWRQIALGSTHLAQGNVEDAAECLKLAAEIRPDNPVVNYYKGILRLEQARYAPDYYDAMGIDVIRLAAYPPNDRYMPDDIVPNSRSMYRMLARIELEKAAGLAGQVDLDEPLTPDYYGEYAVLRPTVRDLLVAMDAENFPARAHNMLGPICIEDGALDSAEMHIDAAREAGMFVGYSYVDLVTEMEKQGHWLDAARVSAKAVGHGMNEADAHRRAVANLRRWWNDG